MPADHVLANILSSWAELPAEKHPLWDIALFYSKRIEWTDGPPMPKGWAKQIAYFGLQDDGTSALFWRDNFGEMPVASDWLIEISHGMGAIIGTATTARRAGDEE